MFGTSHKRGERAVAVVDVGSDSVGVAYLSLAPGKPAHIVAQARSAPWYEARTPEQLVAAIPGQVDEAFAKAHERYAAAGGDPVEQLTVVVHAPFVRAKTVRAHAQFDTETLVTDALIGATAKSGLEQETEIDCSKLLCASVVRVELNGYPTPNPTGKRAHEIAITSLVNDSDDAARSQIEHAVGKHFPGIEIVWRSFTRALLSACSSGAVESASYLAAVVEGHATHLAAVYGGIPGEQRVVPQGVSTILARAGGTATPDETLSLIRMLARDSCESTACEALRKSLAVAEPELVRAFGEAMGSMAAVRRLPTELVLVTHPDMREWLSAFFSRIDFTQFTLTALPYTVRAFGPQDLAASADGFDPTDLSLAIACALVNNERDTK